MNSTEFRSVFEASRIEPHFRNTTWTGESGPANGGNWERGRRQRDSLNQRRASAALMSVTALCNMYERVCRMLAEGWWWGISVIVYPPFLFHLLSARVSEHTLHFQTYHNNQPLSSSAHPHPPPPRLPPLPNFRCIKQAMLLAPHVCSIYRARGCGLK